MQLPQSTEIRITETNTGRYDEVVTKLSNGVIEVGKPLLTDNFDTAQIEKIQATGENTFKLETSDKTEYIMTYH